MLHPRGSDLISPGGYDHEDHDGSTVEVILGSVVIRSPTINEQRAGDAPT